MTLPDPWTALREHTAARIALGRAGDSLPTAEWLRFGVAHAMARDAVHEPLDVARLAAQLQGLGFEAVVPVASAAADRATYLRRPDLGRRLAPRSAASLAGLVLPPAIAVLIGDGLSARAVARHAVPLLIELRPRLERQGQFIGCISIAQQARVALGDEVGTLLRAPAVLVLIGERPGLSSPDSLGAYLTWAPRIGCPDAKRNCVSNIRPEGLDVAAAAHKVAWLLDAARRLGATGVALKDRSDGAAALADAVAVSLPPAPPAPT